MTVTQASLKQEFHNSTASKEKVWFSLTNHSSAGDSLKADKVPAGEGGPPETLVPVHIGL